MAAPTSPDDNLDQFFGYLKRFNSATQSPAISDYNATTLAALFCSNSAGPPIIPAVGITNHGAQGLSTEPYFELQSGVYTIWQSFYESFSKFNFQPALLQLPGANITAPRMNATVTAGPNTIPMRAVQCDLIGTYMKQWSPTNHPPSPPLSNIPPSVSGNGTTHIAATAVFTFDTNNLITRLWIYMDRYKLQSQLGNGSGTVLSAYFKAVEQRDKFLADRPIRK